MYEDVVTVLTGRTTQENALVQDDYPWGRKLRCQRRVWVETASKGSKKGQQRFMAQTENPKTFRWCTPKASIYSDVIVLYLDEKKHVKQACLHLYTKPEEIASFVEMFGEHLTDAQWKSIKVLCAMNRVSKRITWTLCKPGEGQSDAEQSKILARMVAQELRNPEAAERGYLLRDAGPEARQKAVDDAIAPLA